MPSAHVSSKALQLKQELSSVGIDRLSGSKRFQQSLDIVFGEKSIFPQRPNVYFLPGLPQVQFFDREDFPWVAAVESRTGPIRFELVKLLKDRSLFKPHVGASERLPARSSSLAGNAAWSSLYLWRAGEAVEPIAQKCPETIAALAAAPLSHFSKVNPSAPSIMFSLLAAGARIPPHTGATNARLICHLPLIVPPNCGFRVGNEIRKWEEGKLLIFDDTIEHEAWNESNEDRIVLIFDIWRPELSEEERAAIRTLFSALERVRA